MRVFPDLESRESNMPKEKTNWILDYIRDHSDRPMKVKELARAIGIKQKNYTQFRNSVRRLLDEGKLVKLKRSRIGLPDQMDLVTGVISITRAGFGFVQDENRDEEIYIAAHDTYTAFDRDQVLVRLKRGFGFKGKREGVVIKIVERKLTELVGTFHKGRRYDYVMPDVRNSGRDIYVVKGKSHEARDGEKVVVKLEAWDDPGLNPEGEIIECLGLPGEPGVDMLAIIRQYNLPTEFPQEVEYEAEDAVEDWQKEIKNRPDLTGLATFTIDPADARDFDDAISIEKSNGRYRLGVHIADVSHFVRGNTELDNEAFERGTSVYFPDRVIPMLPEVLSNDACSLRPNRKRLTYSLFMDFDENGNVKDYELYPAVIRSRARLSYDEVQKYFDGVEVSSRVERVADSLTILRKLARTLLRRRQEAGSLDFDLPEAKIILDKKGNVIEIGNRIRTEAHRLVEEFMLAANRQVALHFFRNAQPTLFRVHDRPDMEKLEGFVYLVAGFGYRFAVSPQMPTQDFSRFLKKVKGKPEEELINELLLRSMKKAVYQPENIGHFGLAFTHYLHFTSPIRRFPDLLVHRLLKNLKDGKYPVRLAQKLPAVLTNVGNQSSDRERRAMEAERTAVKAKQVAYMAGQVGSQYDGIISGVVNFGFFVRLVGPECEGLVRASTMDDDYYRFDEEGYQLVGRRQGKTYRLGDKVRVGVMRVDVEKREIDLFLVPAKTPRKKKTRGRSSGKKRK
jgi:ribonuclease R